MPLLLQRHVQGITPIARMTHAPPRSMSPSRMSSRQLPPMTVGFHHTTVGPRRTTVGFRCVTVGSRRATVGFHTYCARIPTLNHRIPTLNRRKPSPNRRKPTATPPMASHIPRQSHAVSTHQSSNTPQCLSHYRKRLSNANYRITTAALRTSCRTVIRSAAPPREPSPRLRAAGTARGMADCRASRFPCARGTVLR